MEKIVRVSDTGYEVGRFGWSRDRVSGLSKEDKAHLAAGGILQIPGQTHRHVVKRGERYYLRTGTQYV